MFRLIVLGWFLVLIVGGILAQLIPSDLPLELLAFDQQQMESESSDMELVPILTSLISAIFLVFFKSWARLCFIGSVVALNFIFYKPHVYSSFERLWDFVFNYYTGFIIALMYFSRISSEFKKDTLIPFVRFRKHFAVDGIATKAISLVILIYGLYSFYWLSYLMLTTTITFNNAESCAIYKDACINSKYYFKSIWDLFLHGFTMEGEFFLLSSLAFIVTSIVVGVGIWKQRRWSFFVLLGYNLGMLLLIALLEIANVEPWYSPRDFLLAYKEPGFYLKRFILNILLLLLLYKHYRYNKDTPTEDRSQKMKPKDINDAGVAMPTK